MTPEYLPEELCNYEGLAQTILDDARRPTGLTARDHVREAIVYWLDQMPTDRLKAVYHSYNSLLD